MDTDKLRYFVTISETGSLTKAAGILGISHSGLSKAVAALEVETGFDLFRPLGRGLEITPQGKWFYQKAREILRIADEIASGDTERPGSVRIGLSAVLAMTCAGSMAAELDESMVIMESDVGDIEGKIVSDEIDFGIAFVPALKAELEYLEIGQVKFNSYAREDLLKKKPDDPPFVVPTEEFHMNPLGFKSRDGWPKDLSRTLRYHASSFAIALDLLRTGRAAAYIPDFVAKIENSRNSDALRIAKVAGHAKAATNRKIFLVKGQSDAESRQMKKIAKVIRNICC